MVVVVVAKYFLALYSELRGWPRSDFFNRC